MARATYEVIQAIRNTALSLRNNSKYQWGHMGSCNCGHLAQEITKLTKTEIHTRAMQKYGDWNEQLNDYCPTSGFSMDNLITRMLEFGFTTDDLKHLEKLSDPDILYYLPKEQRLLHNQKKDVITYLNLWASRLEGQLLESIELPVADSEKILL